MHYEVSYELCSLVFLVIITTRFFSVRRFPSTQNRLFGITLCVALANLIMDIVTAYTIEYTAVLPIWTNYVLCSVFYALQMVISALMVNYVLACAGRSYRSYPALRLLLLPIAAFAAAIVVNLFTGILFYVPVVDGVPVYTRGPYFNWLFAGAGFYMAATVVLTAYFRSYLRAKQQQTIYAFIIILIAAIVVQMAFPSFLLTGVALTIAILMFFFTLQNPEDQLDLVTGVFNYSVMMDYLQSQISDKRALRLIAVDVGGFRRINSTYGIDIGNRAFAAVGAFLNSLGGRLVTFRMIGSRFLLVVSDEDDFLRAIIQIGDKFERPWEISGQEMTLTASLRYFDEQDFFTSADEVVNLIDVAYSEASTDGWNDRMRIGGEQLEQAKRGIMIESEIREALQTGKGFEIWLQPIFAPETKRFSSAEVLLRYRGEDGRFISPGEFIPIAEKSGLILRIDELVLKKASAFLAQSDISRDYGLDFIEINLSAAEFFKNDWRRINTLVTDEEASPSLICFEVTESAAVAHPGALVDFMNKMIDRGYRFALDDFGTGFANLTQVAEMPFSIVKLDRSLLISPGEKNRILFDGLMGVFRETGLHTVVEGVETPEQARRVTDLGATGIQGYYFARPMPIPDFVEFIKERNGTAVQTQ